MHPIIFVLGFLAIAICKSPPNLLYKLDDFDAVVLIYKHTYSEKKLKSYLIRE